MEKPHDAMGTGDWRRASKPRQAPCPRGAQSQAGAATAKGDNMFREHLDIELSLIQNLCKKKKTLNN